jgi:hypothetical protein
VLAALTLSSLKLPERIITNLKYNHLRLNREEAGAAEGSFKIVMKLVGQGSIRFQLLLAPSLPVPLLCWA